MIERCYICGFSREESGNPICSAPHKRSFFENEETVFTEREGYVLSKYTELWREFQELQKELDELKK